MPPLWAARRHKGVEGGVRRVLVSSLASYQTLVSYGPSFVPPVTAASRYERRKIAMPSPSPPEMPEAPSPSAMPQQPTWLERVGERAWPSEYIARTDAGGLVADTAGLLIGCILALLLLSGMMYACRLWNIRWRCCISISSYDDIESDAHPSSPGRPSSLLLPPSSVRSDAPTSEAPSRWSDAAVSAHRTEHWSLQGRAAIVTGGSKGLGRAIVEELLAQGCEVLTCARDIAPLAPLTGIDPAGGVGRCIAVKADVSTAEGRATLLEALHRHFSDNLDILVNNVGTNLRKPSHKYTDDEYDMLHATNQASAFHLSRSCFEALRARRGCVINVSSVSGSTIDNTGCPYHMHKAALEQMTRYMACEWGPQGIRVNAIAPWFISTPLTQPLLKDRSFHEAVRRATPMRRVGEPHEVACVVAFLAMPAAGYISGEVIGVDGAMMKEGFRYMPGGKSLPDLR